MRSSSKAKKGKSVADLEKIVAEQKKQLVKTKKLLQQSNKELASAVHLFKQNEARFNALMENSYEAMGLFDKDFNILYRNSAAYKISGWTAADLHNNPPIMNIHPDDQAMVKEKIAEILTTKGESVNIDFRSRHKNGHYLWVEGIYVNRLDDEYVRAVVINLRDITSRKSAEQIAANTEANLNTIFENMSEGVVLMAADGTIQVFNKNAIRFTWLGTGKTLAVGDNIINYINEPRKEFFNSIEKIIRSGKSFEYDREVTEGEKKYWINVSISSILDDGRVSGVCMVTRDITFRKEAELEIVEREEQFRTLIERISDAFISFDKDLRYTYVNKKAGEITHRDPQSLIGKYVWDVFPEAIGSSTYETFNKAMSEQVYLCNTDYFEPLNLWQENHLYPSSNGLSVFIRDISERKRAEKKLMESEQRFRALIENSADAVVLTDSNLQVTYQSPAVERMTGISLAHRKADPSAKYSHPDDQAAINEAITNSLQHPGVPIPFQCRFRHQNGTYIWIEGMATNLLHDPFINALVFNYRNVSERKKVEEEILKLNDELESKVVQRTEQLEALNKELESFTYSVSHDLRAPLRIIDGFSHIILEDYSDQIDASGKRNLNVIINNAKRMGMLIDDLLNFSKVGQAQLRISEVNMTSLVSETIEDLRMSKIEIPVNLKIGELIPVKGDSALLKQVWINLISNAIKYSAKNDSPVITVDSYEDQGRAVYFVKDNGAGFDMLYAHKLFGVFQRLHKLEEYAGTGVGLALVQRIVARHGGSVWAEGKVNEGATFFIALPLK
jgi:PAS domain S-box-containing protein